MGNHEFDRGVAEAVNYMENLNAPIVVANIDDSDEPTFQGKYQKSITIDKYGRRIGVIGSVVRTVNVSAILINPNRPNSIAHDSYFLHVTFSRVVLS